MVDQIRIPPRRPYLTTAEATTYFVLGASGIGLFIYVLLSQYASVSDALFLHANAAPVPAHVPTSSLDGLFATRSTVLGVPLPSGLTAGIGLLTAVYCIAQVGFRLSIRSRLIYDWFFAIAPCSLVIGAGLWLGTFTTVERSLVLPWNYILGLQVFFFGEPLIIIWTPVPDRHGMLFKPAMGLVLMIGQYYVLRTVYDLGAAASIGIIFGSVPAAVLVTFILLMLWMFKVNQTGEYHDYYE